jgi:glycogen synthase
MACGTPVIGSNVGGIKFSVRDGETGYLVPPEDPAALAERIAHLYRHPKLLRVLGERGIRRVNDLFTWRNVAASIAETYQDVVDERQPAAPDLPPSRRLEPTRTRVASSVLSRTTPTVLSGAKR